MENIDWFVVILVIVFFVLLARIIYVTLWLTGHIDDSEKIRKLAEKKLRKKIRKYNKEQAKK
jgi:hypothetical protein